MEIGAGVAEVGGSIPLTSIGMSSSPGKSETLPLLSKIVWDWGTVSELWEAMDAAIALYLSPGHPCNTEGGGVGGGVYP